MFKKNFNIGSHRRTEQKDNYTSKSIVRIVISLLIAVVTFIGAISLESYLLSDKSVEKVVVAKQAINKGTMITDDNNDKYFEVISVKTSLKTPLTYTDISKIKGKVLTDIEPGEMVTANRFSDTKNVEKDLEDPVEITFAVANVENGVCGSIRAGDVCDIMYKSSANNMSVDESALLIENAYIIDTYDSSGVKIDSSNKEAQSMYFKIYVNRAEEAAINKIFAGNDITVTKVVNQDSKAKQTSHVGGEIPTSDASVGNNATNTVSEGTSGASNSEMNMNSWVDQTLGTSN